MSRGQGRVYRPTNGAGRKQAIWWLDYSVGGKRYRESSGTTSRREAFEILRQRIGDRKNGKLAGRPDRVVFAEYIKAEDGTEKLIGGLRAGLERHYQRQGNRSLRRARQALDHLEAFFGRGTRALDITKARVSEYIEHRLAEGAARGTVRYEVAILNAAFSVAVEEELLTVRPAFKLPKVNNRREGFVEPGAFAALLLELPEDVRHVVQLLYATGWRKSEALGLTWDEVHWEGQALRLSGNRTKSGQPRVFPFGMTPDLKGLLEARWKVRNGPFVFHRCGQPIRDFRRAWASATKRAGLPGLLVHDLRRSAARDLVRAGVPQHIVMKLCGWETDAMFRRYAVVDERTLAEAVAQRYGKPTASLEASGETLAVANFLTHNDGGVAQLVRAAES